MFCSRASAAAFAAALVFSGAAQAGDWTRFGYDAGRHGVGPSSTGITAANVGHLRLQRVVLDGTVDSSPIEVAGLVVVTTFYGKTIALDAVGGHVRWQFTPPGFASWAGSYRITNSTPVADPDRRFVYSEAPDGRVYKLALANGHVAWSVAITRNPAREKLSSALNLAGGLVLATTGGYIGDQPPYQGHVAAIDPATGRLAWVWNSLCSDRRGLLEPASCPESGAAIWARSGVVVGATGHLFVATGNGRYDGKTYWGDSVVELSAGGAFVRSFTPSNQADLNSQDIDLGSTAPALLPGGFVAQSGKDAALRLLDGGLHQRQSLSTPGGGGLFSAPAEWGTWLFVSDFGATAGYRLSGGRLRLAWRQRFGGTSPVVAGGLLYVYDPSGGALRVLRPQTGAVIATLPAGSGHWNSPIVLNGHIVLPEGDANGHDQRGVLDFWRLPRTK